MTKDIIPFVPKEPDWDDLPPGERFRGSVTPAELFARIAKRQEYLALHPEIECIILNVEVRVDPVPLDDDEVEGE